MEELPRSYAGAGSLPPTTQNLNENLFENLHENLIENLIDRGFRVLRQCFGSTIDPQPRPRPCDRSLAQPGVDRPGKGAPPWIVSVKRVG
jgi:hypothetical protein